MKNLGTPVIVVDKNTLCPMQWDGDHFTFVCPIKLSSTRGSGRSFVKSYKRCDAKILINSDRQFRKMNRLPEHSFMLMLFNRDGKY